MGADLRMAVLALPPVVPDIQRNFRISESVVGTLTTLPVLMLALGALAGSAAVARLGARKALLASLVVIGAASAARGLGGAYGLFAASAALGAGIAILQPTMPGTAQAWFPARSGLATSIYTNGLVVGEAASASLTLPLVLPLAGSWQLALALWGVPALLAAALVALPFAEIPLPATSQARRWWPSWSDPVVWRVGLLQAGGSVLYFGTNAFIPTELHAVHHPGLVAPCLAALNTAQLSASLIVAFLARRSTRPHWPLAVCALGALGGLAAFVASPSALAVGACALIGTCSAVAFVIALTLPPLLAEPHDVHRLAAATSTIGYVAAFVLPLAGGLLWDATGHPALAFAPAALGAAMSGLVLWWPIPGGRSLADLRIR